MELFAIPYESLVFFQKQLGLNKEELAQLAIYRDVFVSKKEEFGNYFYNFCYQISRTRIILQHERRHGFLKIVWANWFESLFTTELDKSFFNQVWRSGIRHVEVNLDQRFINLGYCIARQYCHQIVNAEIPLASRGVVQLIIDKMLDLCLLIETNAYLAASSDCDQEIIKGISHQIRNPITVIGGNARRIQKKVGVESNLYNICEDIIQESRRLERLVVDVAVYIDLIQHESKYIIISLEDIISGALSRLSLKYSMGANIEVKLDPAFPDVQGDPKDLETMFYYLLENSFEALPAEDPTITITSKVQNLATYFLHVEIFNTGTPPEPVDIEHIYTPFYSSKPMGTGFGLPIARLAARKNLASLVLLPVSGEGTRCIIELPLPG
jgi:signal transduction histidine kinase